MSWCVLEECVKDNYYARFHTAITAIENCTLILDWTLNHWSMKYRSRAPGHGACSKSVSRVIIMQDFILTAITATQKYTLFLLYI